MQRSKRKTSKGGVRVQWSGLKRAEPGEGARNGAFYRLETLASAIEWMLHRRDLFITPSVHAVLGAAEIATLSCELVHEGACQFVFHMQAVAANRKRGSFALNVARDHHRCSTLLRAEQGHLHLLHAISSARVVKPYRGGAIYLPDRHGRKDQGREVYAYVTEWLTDYVPLGLGRNAQFATAEAQPHTYKKKETEAIKTGAVRTLAALYDESQRSSIDASVLAPDDFAIKKERGGAPTVKFVRCRRMQTRLTATRFLGKLLDLRWKNDKQEPMAIVPEDPQLLWRTLADVAGRDAARRWVERYVSACAQGKTHPVDSVYVDLLEAIVLK